MIKDHIRVMVVVAAERTWLSQTIHATSVRNLVTGQVVALTRTKRKVGLYLNALTVEKWDTSRLNASNHSKLLRMEEVQVVTVVEVVTDTPMAFIIDLINYTIKK
jgi:hypothetical protein